MKSKRVVSNMMLVLTALIWGSAFVAQSLGNDFVEPFTFNAVRNIVGGLVLIPCILILNKLKSKEKTEELGNNKVGFNKMLLLGGVLCGIALFGGSTFQQFGLKYTTAGKSGFITALYIVIVPMLGIFMKKKVPAKVWVCVLVAVVGFYLLSIKEGFNINLGDFLTLICSIFFSVHILLIDYFSPRVDGVQMSCIQFFVCGILSLIASFIFENPKVSEILSAWAPILYAGVLSCGVAYTLQIVAQKNTDPVIASLILSLESVFAVIAGWLILKQSLSIREGIGCLLVFIAIVVTQLPDRQKMKANNLN